MKITSEEDAERAGGFFTELVRILDTLRGENGCPWDREQDVKSIVNYFLEEAYEVIDAVFRKSGSDVAEELGDMLMEIVFLARLFKEEGAFSTAQVVEGINQKMVRRHPHVFGNREVSGAAEVTSSWNRQKITEKRRESLFDGIGSSTPALLTAFQIGLRASLHGFDWSNSREVLAKVKEEAEEITSAVESKSPKEVMEEIGDLLFVLANLSRHMGVNPEIALQFANKKFIKRFRYIEQELKNRGKDIDHASLDEMEALWQQAKGSGRDHDA
jgi:tetrapyrrole methylase family protein/MazG family protein